MKDSLFEILIERAKEFVNEEFKDEQFDNNKKELFIKYFSDKLIKEHMKM